MVVSTLAGRIRVRTPRLKDAARARAACAGAEELAGVTSARVNRAAGCLVVTFDPTAVDPVTLEDRLEALCTGAGERRPRRARLSPMANRITKVGLLTSLGTTLALAAAGQKKAHTAAGVAFVLFASLHALQHRRTLLR